MNEKKVQRIKHVRTWLRDVTGLDEHKEHTVGWLILQAALDPTYLGRAGRKVWLALHEPLPDGSVPVPLRNLPAPLNRLYEDQPERMRMYPVFRDFFGIEETIAYFGNFFERADGGHEEERQALWLRGPAGSGKTTFVRTLCERLEDFTFWTIDGCAYHEHPLYMVPKRQRSLLFEAFYPFEGNPCPDCWQRLQKELPHNNRWWEMPVQDLRYSEGAACGIAFVDHRVVDQTDESLPEEWIQILQKEANGGLLVIQCTKEMQPAAFLELIGEVVQSRRMNVKESAARVSLDMAVIFMANTSIREYKSGDVALASRVQECMLPLVVSPRAEKCVVEKLDRYLMHLYHFMPHVENALNIVVCASRLRDTGSPDAPTLLQRLRMYDGVSVEVTGSALPLSSTRKQMRAEPKYSSDGIQLSISIRSALKMRSSAGEFCENGCITINDVVLAVKKQLGEENLSGPADTFPKRFLEDSSVVVEVGDKKIIISQLESLVYQKLVQKDLVRAWVGPDVFDRDMENIKNQYLDHAGAHNNIKENGGFVDKECQISIDESFLRKVEGYAGVAKEKENVFRQEVCHFFSKKQRAEERVGLSDIPTFERALWKYAADTPLAEIRVAFELASGTRDPAKEKKKIEVMEKNLAGDMGYKSCCIRKLLGNYRTTGYIRRMMLKPY
ncbi:MAG: PrkA serine kinase [Parcubacteria group bacterium Gr01-1014_29]|nr:MAG: PrkA serine kinase [Parcubacteria group bacterium Gr01-1014_29]